MKIHRSLCSALLVATLAAACTRVTSNRVSTSTTTTNTTDGVSVQMKSESSSNDSAGMCEVFVDVPEGAVSNVIKLDARSLETGTIALRVFAPDGAKKLDKNLDLAERREHELALETTVGKWRLEAELQGAHGVYVINWVAAR